MKRNIAVASLCAWLLGACYCNTPSTGEKVGQIVRISKQGIFCQTWEAEIIRGGFTDGSGTIGTQPFWFTIEREQDAALIEKFMRDQVEIRLSYRTEGIVKPCRSDSNGSFYVSAEPVKSSKAPKEAP